MTPPYVLDPTSDSSYMTLNILPPPPTVTTGTGGGWLKNISSGIYGDVPTEVGASNTSGFANYFYKNASDNRLSLFGGCANDGLWVGRCWLLNNAPSGSRWDVGASPIYLNPIKNAITNNQIDTIWNS